jgi:hypothetical protein
MQSWPLKTHMCSRAVTGLLTGHNTVRRHFYLQGLLDSHLCKKCGVRQETSAHILCECEVLASLRHAYLGSFFLETENIKSLGFGAFWNFSKVTGPPWFDMGHKGPVKSRPRCIGAERPRNQMQINQLICVGITLPKLFRPPGHSNEYRGPKGSKHSPN